MPTKHARYSPSTLKSYRQCPGYLNANDGDSSAADAGSLLHAIVEHDLGVEIARKETPKLDKIELTEEMMELARLAHGYSSGLIEGAAPGTKVYKEVWLNLRSLNLPGCEGGTADLLILHPDNTIDLVDYKFGIREVDRIQDETTGALINMQFMAYGLGAFLKWPKTKEVRIHMVQPKLEIADVGVMKASDCATIKAEIDAVVTKCIKFEATKDASLLNPDDELCGWCARQPTCPKWTGAVVAVAKAGVKYGIADSEKEFDPELIPESFTGWNPEEADPVEVAKMMRTLTPLESFIRRYKQFALEVNLLPGKALPGYSQVDTSGKNSVISPLDAMLIMEQQFDITREEFVGAASVSVDALKKLVSAKAPTGKKGLMVEQLIETLSDEGILERSPGYSYLKATRTKTAE
jgi:hypothetical protein